MCSNHDDAGYKFSEIKANFEKTKTREAQQGKNLLTSDFRNNISIVNPVDSKGLPFSRIKADPYRRNF
jgi:hypothetical protein